MLRLGRGGGGCGRLGIGLIVALIAVVSYFMTTREETNEVTGEVQRVSLTQEEEIALGLNAAPEMAEQFGGMYADREAQETLDRVAGEVVRASRAGETEYPFEFHLLADEQTVNAFALPGGQIFITAALAQRLGTEGQLAGVIAHEIGHVVGRHSAEQMAKAALAQGLSSAALIALYDPQNPASAGAGQMAAVVGQMVTMKYGRDDELQSDELGVEFMSDAGYDPRSLVEVMRILAEASGGAGRAPEFMSTHPSPDNRIAEIREAIEERFPDGVPPGLTP